MVLDFSLECEGSGWFNQVSFRDGSGLRRRGEILKEKSWDGDWFDFIRRGA